MENFFFGKVTTRIQPIRANEEQQNSKEQ